MIKKPTIFRDDSEELNEIKKLAGIQIVDIVEEQLKELFEIENPSASTNKKRDEISGDWIYYPWSKTLLHTLSEKEIFSLQTNRNRDIITTAEQKKLAAFTIAIAGLSVGGNIATTLAYNGFSKKIKLADFDNLSTTNLNRARAKLADVGTPKIDIIKKQLYELNPYINITSFDDGINKKNLEVFLLGDYRSNLVFEII